MKNKIHAYLPFLFFVSIFLIIGTFGNLMSPVKREFYTEQTGVITDIERIGMFIHVSYRVGNKTRRESYSDVCFKHHYIDYDAYKGMNQPLYFYKATYRDGSTQIRFNSEKATDFMRKKICN